MGQAQNAAAAPLACSTVLSAAQGVFRTPAVYLSGGQMEIEHFRCILTYSPDCLCLQMPHGRFTVHGDELKIITLTATRLTLRGRFLRTDFADE